MKYVSIQANPVTPVDKLFNYFITAYGKYKIEETGGQKYYTWEHPDIDSSKIADFVTKAFRHANWKPKWEIKHPNDMTIMSIKNKANVILLTLIKFNGTLKALDQLFLIKDY